MGFKGPQRRPDSVRGKIANEGKIPEPIQDQIEAPAWLAEPDLTEFWRLVDLNRGAGVSIRRVDAELYADLAVVMGRMRDASDQMYLKLAKQVNELRSALNMGPRNRARAGVKDTQKPKAVNPMAELVRLPVVDPYYLPMASGE